MKLTLMAVIASTASASIIKNKFIENLGQYNVDVEEYIAVESMHLILPAEAELREDQVRPILQMYTIDLNIHGYVSTLNKIKFLAYTRDPESSDTLSTSEEFTVASCSQFKSSMKFSLNHI